MADESNPLRDADRILMAAVDDAIENAARSAGHHFRGGDDTRSRQDYFADGVMRHLFLRLCGADPATAAGGDPEIAWKILYAGRNVARHWEREGEDRKTVRRKRERSEDLDRDRSERRELIRSAQHYAMTLVVQALADQARLSDPQLVERLEAAIDARAAKLGIVSEADALFISSAKDYVSLLTQTREQGAAEPDHQAITE
ncbi:hypothetical protein [Rhizobium sp. SSA_523]|uniref:hypothetical protein n=1 Tax=Rhizobium sp. SSA_523 TaxID=2952477 RepID=UPI002090E188|nr:hypothetical protein [Rhizobium sp. SSA_523]MCO5731262.1 hypothetical protein [Rhizobium sp. SSA_523]WKC22200.1 hypothetical protein QTJ18_03405 [Rhizobium sp. SSA_523]